MLWSPRTRKTSDTRAATLSGFAWSSLAWGLVPVDCRWLFQPELQGPTPRGQKIHVYIVQAIIIVDFLSFSAKPSPLHYRALKEAILVVCSLFSIYS